MDRAYKSTNLRVRAKIDHEINTFSDYFQTIVIKSESTNFKGKRLLDTELWVTSR